MYSATYLPWCCRHLGWTALCGTTTVLMQLCMVLPCQLRGCVPLVRHSLVVQPRMVLPCLLRFHVPKAGQIPLHPDYPSWVPVNSCGLVSVSADGRCVLMPWQKRERARACSSLCFDCSLLRRYPEKVRSVRLHFVHQRAFSLLCTSLVRFFLVCLSAFLLLAHVDVVAATCARSSCMSACLLTFGLLVADLRLSFCLAIRRRLSPR